MVGKWIQRGLLALTAALGVVVIGPGCAEPESSLFIRHVAFLQAPECAARAEPDGLFVGSGVIDTALVQEYVGALLVGNQLVPRGSQDQVRTETSRVTLIHADVHIVDANDNELSSYRVPITGFVDQSQGQEPGYGIATMPLVDSKALGSLSFTNRSEQRRLVSKIKVTGRTLGGSEIESNEFQFVVKACSGCLVQFPPEADSNPTDGVIDCLGGGDVDTNSIPCIQGQDRAIDCRLCAATSPACQKL